MKSVSSFLRVRLYPRQCTVKDGIQVLVDVILDDPIEIPVLLDLDRRLEHKEEVDFFAVFQNFVSNNYLL